MRYLHFRIFLNRYVYRRYNKQKKCQKKYLFNQQQIAFCIIRFTLIWNKRKWRKSGWNQNLLLVLLTSTRSKENKTNAFFTLLFLKILKWNCWKKKICFSILLYIFSYIIILFNVTAAVEMVHNFYNYSFLDF